MPSSLIEAVSEQITMSPRAAVDLDEAGVMALAAVLAAVPDRRSRSGRRYALGFLLAVALCAVLAGSRSIAAIAQWTAGCEDAVLDRLGAAGCFRRPAATTFGRAFAVLDGDDVDLICGSWLAGLLRAIDGGRLDGTGWPVAAADGKTVRGAKDADGVAPHLVAMVRPDAGCVIGQVQVADKSNEIPALRTLLKGIDVTGLVVTADALHTCRTTAQAIIDAGAHYLLILKDNQPTLLDQATALLAPGTAADHEAAGTGIELAERGHGRRERRIVRTADATALDFPAAAQVARITRRRALGDDASSGSKQTVYAITDLTPEQAGPAEISRIAREHWGVEALHHIRDVTYAEDASAVRTKRTPRVMAGLRNLAISLLKLLGWANIAQANRHLAAHRDETLTLLGLAS